MINLSRFKGLLAATLAACALVPAGRADFAFTPGHYYSANYFELNIIEYDLAGNPVGSLTLPATLGSEIRGLAFGHDGLLYATIGRDSDGFAIVALNSSGAVQQTYTGPTYVAGNLSYGKLALDYDHIYIAGQNELTRFEIGNPTSGSVIYTNNQVFDVKVLPSGNLFVASAYDIDEITNNGALVREIPLVANPPASFGDIRGIEYDPATNDLFVTHLGYSDFYFRLMRVDATSGVLEEDVTFVYADDLFLTESQQLLVGSRTGAPRIYTEELDQVGTLGSAERMFVTQFKAPSALAGDFYFLPTPTRFVDTRNGTGGPGGAFSNGEVRSYTFSALPPDLVPAEARGIVGNVAVVPRGRGNLQSNANGVFGANSPAFINFVNGVNLSNHFATALNNSGSVFIKANVFGGPNVDVIIDIVGYYR